MHNCPNGSEKAIKLLITSSNDEIGTNLSPMETCSGSDTGMFTSSYCLLSVLLASEDSITLTPAMNPNGETSSNSNSHLTFTTA